MIYQRLIRFLTVLASVLFATTALAHDMQLTIYDDGLSCPGNCDAHVVANAQDNGTKHAYLPGTQAAPQACVAGQPCEICFGHDSDSCMQAIYRGGGPPAGKLDFTPAFYAEHCGTGGIPEALQNQCDRMDRAVVRLGYDVRVNCIENLTQEGCDNMMAAAQQAYAEDVVAYQKCIAMGETAFNAAQDSDATRRTFDCAYSKEKRGGPNSNGTRWHVLLPGACRAGTFVGKDGLDCCSSDVRFAATIHRECLPYFVEQ